MFIATKEIIRNGKLLTVRIKSLNWEGTRYGLYINGEQISIGSMDVIESMYEQY